MADGLSSIYVAQFNPEVIVLNRHFWRVCPTYWAARNNTFDCYGNFQGHVNIRLRIRKCQCLPTQRTVVGPVTGSHSPHWIDLFVHCHASILFYYALNMYLFTLKCPTQPNVPHVKYFHVKLTWTFTWNSREVSNVKFTWINFTWKSREFFHVKFMWIFFIFAFE